MYKIFLATLIMLGGNLQLIQAMQSESSVNAENDGTESKLKALPKTEEELSNMFKLIKEYLQKRIEYLESNIEVDEILQSHLIKAKNFLGSLDQEKDSQESLEDCLIQIETLNQYEINEPNIENKSSNNSPDINEHTDEIPQASISQSTELSTLSPPDKGKRTEKQYQLEILNNCKNLILDLERTNRPSETFETLSAEIFSILKSFDSERAKKHLTLEVNEMLRECEEKFESIKKNIDEPALRSHADRTLYISEELRQKRQLQGTSLERVKKSILSLKQMDSTSTEFKIKVVTIAVILGIRQADQMGGYFTPRLDEKLLECKELFKSNLKDLKKQNEEKVINDLFLFMLNDEEIIASISNDLQNIRIEQEKMLDDLKISILNLDQEEKSPEDLKAQIHEIGCSLYKFKKNLKTNYFTSTIEKKMHECETLFRSKNQGKYEQDLLITYTEKATDHSDENHVISHYIERLNAYGDNLAGNNILSGFLERTENDRLQELKENEKLLLYRLDVLRSLIFDMDIKAVTSNKFDSDIQNAKWMLEQLKLNQGQVYFTPNHKKVLRECEELLNLKIAGKKTIENDGISLNQVPNQSAPGYSSSESEDGLTSRHFSLEYPVSESEDEPVPGYFFSESEDEPVPGYFLPESEDEPVPGYFFSESEDEPVPGYFFSESEDEPVPGYFFSESEDEPVSGYFLPESEDEPVPGYFFSESEDEPVSDYYASNMPEADYSDVYDSWFLNNDLFLRELPTRSNTTGESVDETLDSSSTTEESVDETLDSSSITGESVDETLDSSSITGESVDETLDSLSTIGESTSETSNNSSVAEDPIATTLSNQNPISSDNNTLNNNVSSPVYNSNYSSFNIPTIVWQSSSNFPSTSNLETQKKTEENQKSMEDNDYKGNDKKKMSEDPISDHISSESLESFTDLTSVPWAHEAIHRLREKGIIAGLTFKPNMNITRGDFIGWLVKTLDLEANETEQFQDVNSSSDYAKEINIAKSLGLAKGYQNKLFPDQFLTREDMMVFVERAIKISNKNLIEQKNDLTNFSDYKEISTYAVGSAAKLVKSGIVKGNGKKIEPKKMTSRAEAAVVIVRLFDL